MTATAEGSRAIPPRRIERKPLLRSEQAQGLALVSPTLAYALILHAYAVKIIVSGSLPKGQVATMVSIFAVAGTGAWLIAWPWRETGTRLLRLLASAARRRLPAQSS